MTTNPYIDAVPPHEKEPETPMGKWVRRVRGPLSQEQFAARVGVHPVTANRWESAGTLIRTGNLQKILAAFPGSPSPPIGGMSDPERSLPVTASTEGDYIVQTDQGRILAKEIDSIEDDHERNRALRKCFEALDPSGLGADKRADRAQRNK